MFGYVSDNLYLCPKNKIMGFGKWIGGVVGFMTHGPLGAMAGYVLGRMLDDFVAGGDSAAGSSPAGNGEACGQRNSFLFSLLVMASYIIRADGRIMHSEMEFVRAFLRKNFGESALEEGERILLNLFEQAKTMERQSPGSFRQAIADCGRQLRQELTYEERLQLLSFLSMIAASDGNVCTAEVAALKEVAGYMGLSEQEVDSLLHIGGDTLEEAYQVLEIAPTATDSEVRAAYRRLALKHHPDRVAALGEDIRKAAEVKFQQINNAKDRIYKARGLR